ncbi:MAG: MSHA biogenesis protein MshO [Oceanicoccus sp.]|jgi:MSHA biogenesis protein MshO
MMPLPKTKSSGFTLIELVAVIVLLGIVGIATTQFIGQGVGIYVDTARRDNLQQLGRFAIERISREVRNAAPGSVRVSGDCIEYTPIEAASSYLGSVADSEMSSFQAVDFVYTDSAVPNRRVAIYTVENQDIYNSNREAVIDLDHVDTANSFQRQVNLKNYVGSGHQFSSESPTSRFFIITQPVSFCVRANQLFRHSSYGWLTIQATDTGTIGSGVKLAEFFQAFDDTDGDGEVDDPITIFSYAAGTLQRSGVVSLDFRLSDPGAADEWMRFSHQVFVRNTP